jgi:DNA integrity scanning protein DisA with diadenylate cyclase activity
VYFLIAHKSRKIKKIGRDMNIEQKTNMQELTEEDYTKVYAGINVPLLDEGYYFILPIGPIKPKKPDVDR